MNKSESIKEISKAMASFQKDLKPVAFDAVNPFFKSKYATLSAIWDAIREPLAKNGLSVVQGGSEELTTLVMHTSGEWIEGTVLMKAENNTPQKAGAAITYARRYGLSSMLGISSEEDDDGNGAQKIATEKIVDTAKKIFQGKETTSLKATTSRTEQEILNAIDKDEAIPEVGKKKVEEEKMPSTPADIRKRIGEIVLEVADGDPEMAQDILEKMSSFKGRDGKMVPGKKHVADLTENSLFTNYGKAKKLIAEKQGE